MQIILNADDFGRSASVNSAIFRAHREGLLTSTSLMVTGDAVDEAVALAHRAPNLAVGLHLVVVAGRAVLPPNRIPHIVDDRGCFAESPLRAGWHYFFSRVAQQELAQELEAQFQRFAATGLPLSHVDGHLHMHLHPTVLELLLPLAIEYGAKGLRLPRDDLWLSLAYDRRRAGTKITWSIVFGALAWYCWGRIGRRLSVTHQVYGLMQTGQMEEAYVLSVLRQLQVSSAELYFHPSILPEGGPLGPNPGDLDTLLSPSVRQAIEKRGMDLATYSSLNSE